MINTVRQSNFLIGNTSAKRTCLSGILTLLCFYQFLKIICQFFKLCNGHIDVTRTISMTCRPQFQILNPIVILNAIFMMYCFKRIQMPAQLFFHNQSVFKDISISCRRVFSGTYQNISRWRFSSSAFPVVVFSTFLLFGNNNSSKAFFTNTSQIIKSQATSNRTNENSFRRMTFIAGALNGH